MQVVVQAGHSYLNGMNRIINITRKTTGGQFLSDDGSSYKKNGKAYRGNALDLRQELTLLGPSDAWEADTGENTTIDYSKCTITDLHRGRGWKAKFIYACLRDGKGNLIMSATLNDILRFIPHRFPKCDT